MVCFLDKMKSTFAIVGVVTGLFNMIVFSDSENTWTDYIVHSGEPYSGSCENCLLKCLQKASAAAVNVGAKYNPWTYECTVITLYDLQYNVTFSDDVLIKRRMDVIYNEPREVVDGSYYWSKLPGELRIGSYVDIYLSSSFDSIRVMFGLVGGNFMSIAARYATSDLVVRCSFNGSQHCTALYQTVPLVLDTMQKFTFQVTTEGFKTYLDDIFYFTFNDPLNPVTVEQVENLKITCSYPNPAFLHRVTYNIISP